MTKIPDDIGKAMIEWCKKEYNPNYSGYTILIPAIEHGYSLGLTKGIEIAEGFAEWVDDNYLQEVKGQWYSLGLKKDERAEFFTTSQLLEKYLETLNKEKT